MEGSWYTKISLSMSFFFASSTASTAAAAELGGGRLCAIGFAIGFSVGRGVGKLDALLVVGVSVLARTAVINVSPTSVYGESQ
jgi:hypothetical protein